MPTVSVIVPAYNAEKTLERCLESIFSQSYSDLEVIIVNDGSTDNTEAIIERLAKEDARVKFFKQNNLGAGPARNLGLAYSSGDYVCFVDSDDCIDPEMIETLLTFIQNDSSEMSICQINNVVIDENNEFSSLGIHLVPKDARVITGTEALTMQLNFIVPILFNSMCARLIKRNFLIDNQIKFPENFQLAEDSLTSVRTFICANKISLCKQPLYYYVHDDSSATTSFSDKKAHDILLYITETSREISANLPNMKLDNFILGMLFPMEKQLIFSQAINPSYRNIVEGAIVKARSQYKPHYFKPEGIPIAQKIKIASGYHGFTKIICKIIKALRWIPFFRYMV